MPGHGYTTVSLPITLVERIKAIIRSESSSFHNDTIAGVIVEATLHVVEVEERKIFGVPASLTETAEKPHFQW